MNSFRQWWDNVKTIRELKKENEGLVMQINGLKTECSILIMGKAALSERNMELTTEKAGLAVRLIECKETVTDLRLQIKETRRRGK